MAQASEYNRQANFRNLQTLNPSQPTPGGKLDDEFNAIKLTTDELRARNRQIQRDDGQLANQSVGRDQLRTEVQVGLNTPRIWRPNFEFLDRDTTLVGDKFYLCEVTHISSATFEADLAAERWTMLADFTLYSQQVLEAGAAAVAAVAAVEAATVDANESKEAAAAARDSASGHRLVAQNAAGVSTTARDDTLEARDITTAARDQTVALAAEVAGSAGNMLRSEYDPASKRVDVYDGANLNNGSVANAKLANMPANTIKGRSAANGSPQDLSASQVRSILDISAFAATLLDDPSGAAMFATMGAAQLFANSGYVKFPNGLILQVSESANNSADYTVPLPIQFPNGHAVTVLTVYGNYAASYVVFADQTTISSYAVRKRLNGAGTTDSIVVKAFSFGW